MPAEDGSGGGVSINSSGSGTSSMQRCVYHLLREAANRWDEFLLVEATRTRALLKWTRNPISRFNLWRTST